MLHGPRRRVHRTASARVRLEHSLRIPTMALVCRHRVAKGQTRMPCSVPCPRLLAGVRTSRAAARGGSWAAGQLGSEPDVIDGLGSGRAPGVGPVTRSLWWRPHAVRHFRTRALYCAARIRNNSTRRFTTHTLHSCAEAPRARLRPLWLPGHLLLRHAPLRSQTGGPGPRPAAKRPGEGQGHGRGGA